ncbi:hypothetical protein Aspvir_005989 [Aspergillus viridinutans]|uniref:Uncharacterized protein n=1 Tax=Aspergillus viridinutans TaxID=75553 RepID=A0A9P3F5D5_ASPVI|nr:uncharacterized protein Aspvir_005989 [Aspergillus viridinutans]GIK01948.1 hypothetical protein Aspvir_005989 [Aspergillus viridinutans]
MPIPMQVSLPLALHLCTPQTYNIMTDERWKPGEKLHRFSLNDFAFIEQQSGRTQATLLFAAILRDIFNHSDWSQLYSFFTKRFPQGQEPNDASMRTLEPPKEQSAWKKPTMVDFMTDPSSVGLPKDLVILLATAGRTSRSRLMGPDPQPCAIGPAISVACGAGGYMDLAYAGRPPGQYEKLHYINGELYGWKKNKFDVIAGDISTTKKGGRDRHWAEWAELWSAIAEWVYEHDSKALQLGHLSTHSFKYRPSPEEERSFDHFGKIPRQYLRTDAIAAAEAIHDVFAQLAEEPERFQGVEWDFLELAVPVDVREAFHARFGQKGPDHNENRARLVHRVPGPGRDSLAYGDSLAYEEVSPMALKRCPDGFFGASWEAWLLSIEGGDVVIVETIFQALWAVMLLSQLPLNIEIIGKTDRFPRCRDPDTVYI